jgi:agmatine deiminase
MAKQITPNDQSPAELGFSMPAEWEKHEATWLGWPHNPTDWPDKLDTIRWVYGEMVRKIGAGEFVRILTNNRAEERLARRYLRRAGADLGRVQFVIHPTNRGWTRDSGPIFVRRRPAGPEIRNPKSEIGFPSPPQYGCPKRDVRFANCGRNKLEPGLKAKIGKPGQRIASAKFETAIVHFHFNAWAKYDDWQKDRRVPETAAKLLRKRLFNAECNARDFVVEGGGIEVNGRGTLLTTEECYLDPKVQVRNPGLGRKEIDDTLKKYLGVTNVQWLVAGPVGDDTHGHIDDICRFVNPNTLVLIKETNRKDPNYHPLCENWERIQELRLEDGSKPTVVALPMPAPLQFDGYRLPASYANFYISNAAVIVPTFNDPNDRVALGILSDLFKDRPVIGIHAVDLVLGFGSLHCLTQQEPAD